MRATRNVAHLYSPVQYLSGYQYTTVSSDRFHWGKRGLWMSGNVRYSGPNTANAILSSNVEVFIPMDNITTLEVVDE